jgi:heterodisulfide reductase subunit A
MIIGGGIAGIEASLNLAELGVPVYLVESSPSIGGIMARLDKTFPTNDCSICIEAPKMYEVKRNPNITIMSYCDVKEVKGRAGDFEVTLLKKARFIDEEKCVGCGKCVEACPVEVADDLDGKIGGKRKLIYTPFPQSIPNIYTIDYRCRYVRQHPEMRERGVCVDTCIIDCASCRECPIAKCIRACKDEGRDAVKLWQRDRRIKLNVASIILATGFRSSEPPTGVYGYNIYPDVLTILQYERMLHSCGPTGGELRKPSNSKKPKRIAWILCALKGERYGVPYCSKICCMISTKQAILTKDHEKDVETYIFYTNLRTYAKDFYNYYRRALDLNVQYVRGRPSHIYQEPGSSLLTLTYEDTVNGQIGRMNVDIVVLATPFLPSEGNREIAKILNVELDDYGFIKESERNPTETGIEGIYVCGSASGPKDISESVAEAIAASMNAAKWALGA